MVLILEWMPFDDIPILMPSARVLWDLDCDVTIGIEGRVHVICKATVAVAVNTQTENKHLALFDCNKSNILIRRAKNVDFYMYKLRVSTNNGEWVRYYTVLSACIAY